MNKYFKSFGKFIVIMYKITISMFFIKGNCRFTPTCSNYAKEALTKYRITTACWIIIKRLIKCHPWGPTGYDPLPKCKNKK